MKRFLSEGSHEQDGRELIRAHRNGAEAPLDPSFEGGGVAGARTLSRRQALGLLGGCLAGASLLSFGLAAPANAAGSIVGPRGAARPELSGKRGGNWFDLTLVWTCVFTPDVVNHKFGTNWTLMEQDRCIINSGQVCPPVTSPDDVVSATVEPHLHSATSATKTFIPSQANPSNPRAVSFTQTIIWHQDDLDTELGGEEIYASVRLKDFTLMTPSFIRFSEVLPLSP
jgi:hypothetical protein